MEEVPENEIIQMEDNQVVAPTSTTLTDTDDGVAATVDTQVSDNEPQEKLQSSSLPATSTAPEIASGRYDDEDITYHKVER